MRNLTKTIAVVSILAPASAHPLGIGDIKLLSSLNQKLNAEIALVLSGEKPSDIQVHLAPPDKFNEAGIPWSYFLSEIRFETVVKPNGSVVIKLTSNEALKEPFLDLLLEVSWPKGNLYREFTVLVDPPAVYKEPSVPVLSNPQTYQQTPEPLPKEDRQSTARETQTHFATTGEYGPTKRNDTLWKIAEQVRTDGDVSVEQMMMALYQANSDAFYQPNVNALSTGKTLKIPERDAILKLSKKEALSAFNQQIEAWKNRLAPTSNPDTPLAQNEPPVNLLKLNAPAEAPVNDKAIIEPGTGQNAETDVNAGSPINKAENSNENPANETIQSEIAALKKQVEAMQKIIDLKDKELAELQKQPSPEIANATPTPVIQTEPLNQPDIKKEIAPSSIVGSGEQASPTPATPNAQSQSTAAPTTTPTQTTQPTPRAAQIAKPISQPKPATPPKGESTGDSYYSIVGGLGISMLSILGWLWWRKRKVEEEMSHESMFASSTINKTYTSSSAIANDSTSPANPSANETSSFLSEFSATDFGNFDVDQNEIDPLSEADVYLAYGRFHQAEELIRHAINDFPLRDDCKLKLLEIFQATDNKVAFENYAKELERSGKKNDLPFWAKVIEMASEVCPNSSLFAPDPVNFSPIPENQPASINLSKHGSVQKEELEDNTAFVNPNSFSEPTINTVFNQTDHTELGPSFSPFDAPNDSLVNEENNYSSINFDHEILATKKPAVPQPDELNLDADNLIDFNFETPEIAPKAAAKPETNIESLDFNDSAQDTDALQLAAAQDSNLTLEDSFEGFDFSFDDESLPSKKSKPDLTSNAINEDFQFDFGLEIPLANSAEPISNQDVSDVSDNELETKLDIAKAYIEMGDPDAAKKLVKEVMEQGTAEQKKIAEALFSDLP